MMTSENDRATGSRIVVMAEVSVRETATVTVRDHRDQPVDDAPVGIRAGITIRPDRRVMMRLVRV